MCMGIMLKWAQRGGGLRVADYIQVPLPLTAWFSLQVILVDRNVLTQIGHIKPSIPSTVNIHISVAAKKTCLRRFVLVRCQRKKYSIFVLVFHSSGEG